jgi:hypothetical protein
MKWESVSGGASGSAFYGAATRARFLRTDLLESTLRGVEEQALV